MQTSRPRRFICPVLFTALTSVVILVASASASAAPVDFAKGLWTIELTGSYLDELGPHDQQIAAGTFGVNYYAIENVAIIAQFGIWDINQPGDDATAGLAGIGIRHHPWQFEKGSVFFDFTQSVFQADDNVPQDGTSFNFVFKAGVGITYQLSEHAHLMTGVRYWHLSNADREGDERNPADNGIQGFAGVMWTF